MRWWSAPGRRPAAWARASWGPASRVASWPWWTRRPAIASSRRWTACRSGSAGPPTAPTSPGPGRERLLEPPLPPGGRGYPRPGPVGGHLVLAGRGGGRGPSRRPGEGMGAGSRAPPAGGGGRPLGDLVPDHLPPARPRRPGAAPDRGRVPGHPRVAERPDPGLALRLLRALRLRHHLPPARPEPARDLLRVAHRDRPRPQAPRDGDLQRRRQPALSQLGLVQPARALPLGGPGGPLASGRAGVPGAGGHGLGAAAAATGRG